MLPVYNFAISDSHMKLEQVYVGEMIKRVQPLEYQGDNSGQILWLVATSYLQATTTSHLLCGFNGQAAAEEHLRK